MRRRRPSAPWSSSTSTRRWRRSGAPTHRKELWRLFLAFFLVLAVAVATSPHRAPVVPPPLGDEENMGMELSEEKMGNPISSVVLQIGPQVIRKFGISS
jgi:hypothetical protein